MLDNYINNNGKNIIRLKDTHAKDKSILFKNTYQNILALLINKWKSKKEINKNYYYWVLFKVIGK